MIVEEIIRFLFDNIIFLFIIVAGLLSFFRRMGASSEQSERQPKPQQRHPQQPLPPVSKPFFNDMLEDVKPKEEMKQMEEYTPVESLEERLESYEASETDTFIPEASFDNVDDLISVDLSRLQSTESSREVASQRSSVSHKRAFHRPTQQQVTDGVVWAEILGPPRAKRPYTPRNRFF